MDLVIPEEILDKINLSPEELRLELAIYLYAQEKLSMGQARELAETDQTTFQQELKKRDVPIQYDITDLREDMKNLGVNEK